MADVIHRANPSWTAGAINALITANNVVVRLGEKGAAALKRFVDKHDAETAPPGTDAGGPGDGPH